MLDWLTLQVCVTELSDHAREVLGSSQSRIISLDHDGQLVWERPGRRSVRSDSHCVTVEYGTELRVYGSPARVLGDGQENVFGCSDIGECARAMVGHVERFEGVRLPALDRWRVTRLDVTENYFLGSLTNVKQALSLLRDAEGGRYQVRAQAESVYWSVNSTRRSGKAYAKGPHLEYMRRRGKALIDPRKIELAQGLLRLELSLRRHWFQRVWRRPWWEISPVDLEREFCGYFDPLIGSVEVNEMTDIEAACVKAAESLGYSAGVGRGAWLSWNTIRAVGYQVWRDKASRATFYRHKKVLKAAGLSYADFAAGNVVPIRRRSLVLDRPVRSWAELANAA